MHWELWSLNTGNAIGGFDTEAEAAAMARDLLADGWNADDLGICQEWDDGEEGDDSLLPPALYGLALQCRVTELFPDNQSATNVNGRSMGAPNRRATSAEPQVAEAS